MTAPLLAHRTVLPLHRHTVLVVLFATPVLDLSALPAGTPVVLVHNDGALREVVGDERLRLVHVRTPGNVGFGAAVNAGLPQVRTSRVLLCNPDVQLEAEHWQALSAACAEHEVVTLRQADAAGTPGSAVNRYPGPLVHLLQALRVGRLAPRGSLRRSLLTRLLGGYGAVHRRQLVSAETQRLPLSRYWASGSLLSIDAERLRAVGGFDDGYFLYAEDVDLCRRLAQRHPDSELVVPANVRPALHAVGGSAVDDDVRALVRHERLRSAQRYAGSSSGAGWVVARLALRLLVLRDRRRCA